MKSEGFVAVKNRGLIFYVLLTVRLCILYTAVYCSILYTAVYCILLYTVYCIQYTVYSIQYTVYRIPYTVYSVLYTVYCVQYTVYCCTWSQIGAQFFLVCLFLFSICFGRLCAHHQETQLYLYDTWYLSHFVDDCPVCIPDSHSHSVTNCARSWL